MMRVLIETVDRIIALARQITAAMDHTTCPHCFQSTPRGDRCAHCGKPLRTLAALPTKAQGVRPQLSQLKGAVRGVDGAAHPSSGGQPPVNPLREGTERTLVESMRVSG